jgi:hypothetical protein
MTTTCAILLMFTLLRERELQGMAVLIGVVTGRIGLRRRDRV